MVLLIDFALLNPDDNLQNCLQMIKANCLIKLKLEEMDVDKLSEEDISFDNISLDDPVKVYLRDIGRIPLLTPEEEIELAIRISNGDKEARNILIERNLRLVAHIVKKYSSNDAETEDLISIGTIGLIKAIDSFDVDKGARLATYAARCIENAILTLRRTLVILISPLILLSTQKLNRHIMYRL